MERSGWRRHNQNTTATFMSGVAKKSVYSLISIMASRLLIQWHSHKGDKRDCSYMVNWLVDLKGKALKNVQGIMAPFRKWQIEPILLALWHYPPSKAQNVLRMASFLCQLYVLNEKFFLTVWHSWHLIKSKVSNDVWLKNKSKSFAMISLLRHT